MRRTFISSWFISVLYSLRIPGNPVVVAQDEWRRYAHMGRLRFHAAIQVNWYFCKTCGMVYSLDTEDSQCSYCPYGVVRRREGLGRIMFALEHERPFLGPLRKFISIHPRNSTRRIPSYVSFILQYLSAEISKKKKKKRHFQCGTRITTADCSPRVDAQASSTRTGIGGWFLARDSDGNLSPWHSQWFSFEVTREDFPWIFEKGQRPSLVISTLEALAILIALKLKFGEEPDVDDASVLIVPSATDNRGNGAVLNKLMSTRFPSSALMDMVSAMKARGLRAGLHGSSTRKQTHWRMELLLLIRRSVCSSH